MIQYGDRLTIVFKNVHKHNNPDEGWKDNLEDFQVTEYQKADHIEYHFFQKLILKLYLKYLRTKPKAIRYRYETRLAKFFSRFGIYRLEHGFVQFPKSLPLFRDKILQGYFESPKYFEAIDRVVCKEFAPKHELLKENSELLANIQSCESVCVSIRRGDFLNELNRSKCFICTNNYYLRGIDVIRKHYPELKVFVFSDDIDWVKQNMGFDSNTVYESGLDPVWEKLRLMSACKHFVISNSTFSWWVQHLASNPEKIVVAPNIWRNSKLPVDIFEENWTLIDP